MVHSVSKQILADFIQPDTAVKEVAHMSSVVNVGQPPAEKSMIKIYEETLKSSHTCQELSKVK